jgi:hypothetical protein
LRVATISIDAIQWIYELLHKLTDQNLFRNAEQSIQPTYPQTAVLSKQIIIKYKTSEITPEIVSIDQNSENAIVTIFDDKTAEL